jgi:hypothetical protein
MPGSVGTSFSNVCRKRNSSYANQATFGKTRRKREGRGSDVGYRRGAGQSSWTHLRASGSGVFGRLVQRRLETRPTLLDGVKPATRTRNGANYLATFLLMIKVLRASRHRADRTRTLACSRPHTREHYVDFLVARVSIAITGPPLMPGHAS